MENQIEILKKRNKRLIEIINHYEERDGKLLDEITDGIMSNCGYTLDSILRIYNQRNIKVSDFKIYFDDIINCDLRGDDLIEYMKKVYTKIYDKYCELDFDYILTFDEIVERLK